MANANPPGPIWLASRLCEIKSFLGKSQRDRASNPKHLLLALGTTLRIIQQARKPEQRRLREALRAAIRSHYRDANLRIPRSGTNPLVPIVKLCIPGKGQKRDKDRYRYVGYLSYCIIHDWHHDSLTERFEKGVSVIEGKQRPGPAPNKYSINRLSKRGRALWLKKGEPNLGIKISWTGSE